MSVTTRTAAPAAYRPDALTFGLGLLALLSALLLVLSAMQGGFTGWRAFAAVGFLVVGVLAVTSNPVPWTATPAARIAGWAAAAPAMAGLLLAWSVGSAAEQGRLDVAAAATSLLIWALVPVGAYVVWARYAARELWVR